MLQDDLDNIREEFYPLKVNFCEGMYLIIDKNKNIIVNKITEQTWKYASKESKKLMIKKSNMKRDRIRKAEA